jgi:cellulose synthase/poly-beta-1,6-N-acetylglucosamine synthase-like glycosyltransferase
MSGLTKLAESSICGVLYPHGAGWFCEKETLIDLISNYHSIDFIAEDVNTGLSMQRMKKRIAFDATCVLETEVPTTVLGPGLNWWNQRYRSWEMGRHGRLIAFADRMLLSLNGQTTPWGIFTQKFIHLYSIATIIVDWVRIPVFVTMGGDKNFWRLGCLLMLAATLPILAFKYFNARHRPDLQPRFWAAITYPLYKQLYALVSIFGAIRAVIFYAGGHKKPKTIKNMIKDNDPNALWLDPRFDSNPAFLADEAEALLAPSSVEAEKAPFVYLQPGQDSGRL